MTRSPLIPVILGQTASGKTSVGIELAKLLEGEIISVDSRKVYRGLPIGTATPEGTFQNGALVVENIPHHLIGHLPPDAVYTAGDFAKDAERLIEEILNRGKRPLLVGGTGFYFKALQQGLPALPPRDDQARERLNARAEKEGIAALRHELERVDPAAAATITANDRQKIIRALEVLEVSGRPFSEWKGANRSPSPHSFAVMGLHWPQKELEDRINERSRAMEKDGMIEEAKAVLDRGYSKTCPALASFGYREAVQVLEGALPRSEFLPRLIKGTKAYAKRQRTWFRTQIHPHWFDVNSSSEKPAIALLMKGFIESGAK